MQPARVFAENVAALDALVKSQPVAGDFRSGDGGADHGVHRRAGQYLPPLVHAAAGKAAVVDGHIPRRGLDHGAATERGQHAPVIVAAQRSVLVALEQGGDVAAGQGAGGGAVVVHDGTGHAKRAEDALHAELLQRHARRLVGHIGQYGIALVAIAHIFPGRAHGGVGAGGNIINYLIDGFHGVGSALAHGARPLALATGAVHGNRPFQRFHGRYAAGVVGQRTQRHRVARRAGHAEAREIAIHRVVPGELSLAFQNGKRQRGDGFGHGGDSEHGILIRANGMGSVAKAVSPGKGHAVRPAGAHGDAAQAVAGNQLGDARAGGGKIDGHGVSFFRIPGRPGFFIYSTRESAGLQPDRAISRRAKRPVPETFRDGAPVRILFARLRLEHPFAAKLIVDHEQQYVHHGLEKRGDGFREQVRALIDAFRGKQ